jgi:hypothetical protein
MSVQDTHVGAWCLMLGIYKNVNSADDSRTSIAPGVSLKTGAGALQDELAGVHGLDAADRDGRP